MRVAVCDDNDIDREIACTMLRQCFSDLGIKPELVSYEDGLVMIDDVRDGALYDIIFLDIYLDTLLGIDVAHRLRELDFEGGIIFLTATPDFAINGYDVSAVGYIVKPLNAEKLRDVLKRVTRLISVDTYTIRRRAGALRIPLDEIMYVESSNSKCVLHRSDGNSYNIYKKLDTIEKELARKQFLRCSQSYIVNMDYIVESGRSFRLKNGDIVLIRQRNLKAIQEMYLAYVRENGTTVKA